MRAAAVRPARPTFAPMPPPAATGVDERAWLLAHVIKPLTAFSVNQEAATAKEQDRADTLIGIIDGTNAALDPYLDKLTAKP
jgi:hypothetical protein